MSGIIQSGKNIGNAVIDKVEDFGASITDTASSAVSYSASKGKSVIDSLLDTSEKAGTSEIFRKIKGLKMLDEMDLNKIIILLIAIIAIIVVVFILPKLNKSADLEKRILDSKFIKFIVCLVLIYAFYQYNVEIFLIMLVIVFFLYWFHHGYSVENYGPVKTACVGSKFEKVAAALEEKPVVVVKKIEGGEVVVNDFDDVKEKIVEEVKAEEKKKGFLDRVLKSETVEDFDEVEEKMINDAVKSADEIVDETGEVDVPADIPEFNANGLENDTIGAYDRQQEIFDQRDFMIMPEGAPERQSTFERICDCTKCTKPSSYVDRRVF